VTIEEQVTDVLTKKLFEHFRDNLGMVPLQRE
jgi:hypothetical protein